MIKIWTAGQLMKIQKLFSEGKIPERVVERAKEIISILDKHYGANRPIENDGGFLLIFTDCFEDNGAIQDLLKKYHVSEDDAELEDTLYSSDEIIWKEILYILTNEYGVTIIYPCVKQKNN